MSSRHARRKTCKARDMQGVRHCRVDKKLAVGVLRSDCNNSFRRQDAYYTRRAGTTGVECLDKQSWFQRCHHRSLPICRPGRDRRWTQSSQCHTVENFSTSATMLAAGKNLITIVCLICRLLLRGLFDAPRERGSSIGLRSECYGFDLGIKCAV
jgi:hypothetical protein